MHCVCVTWYLIRRRAPGSISIKTMPMTLVLQTEGVPVHAHCCSALGAWCVFTKLDQQIGSICSTTCMETGSDLICVDFTTHAPCPGDSWLMSGLSVQIIGLVNCRRLNERLARCLSSLCAHVHATPCFCKLSGAMSFEHPPTAAIIAAARLTVGLPWSI